jgi:hypothetical protein
LALLLGPPPLHTSSVEQVFELVQSCRGGVVHTLRTWGFPLYRRGSVVRAPGYAGADRRRRGRATRRLQTVASAEFPAVTGEDDAGHPAVREAVLNRALTHSGDPDLARHVGNAVVRNDSRGIGS